MSQPTLWGAAPNGEPLKIEVIGGTGGYASGKTVFGLAIAPGKHPAGHSFAGNPRTLYLDFEKSGGAYESIGCERIDVPSLMMEQKSGREFSPMEVYEWFVQKIEQINPSQYDVIVCDPITDIEGGMVEWVKKHPAKVGLTAAQISRGGGLLWGAVKTRWKQVLMLLASRCQTFYFTSHLRTVWVGNSPTGRKEPKGKDTLMELASLYLWFDRSPNDAGEVPGAPSAEVIKSRQSVTHFADDGTLQIVQLLPPRLARGTVEAIRHYIANPPNYDKLKAEELAVVYQPTEEDMIAARTREHEARREAAEAEIAAKQAEQPSSEPPKTVTVTAPPMAGKSPADIEPLESNDEFLARIFAGIRMVETAPEEDKQGHIDNQRKLTATDNQKRAVMILIEETKDGRNKLRELLEESHVAKFGELSRYDASQILIALWYHTYGKAPF